MSNPLRPALLAAARSSRLEAALSSMRVTRRLVDRFVAGSTETDVVAAVSELLASGRWVSIDYLGEDTTDASRAAATVDAYISLMQRLSTLHADAGALEISVKLSAMGQNIDDGLALENARAVCEAADAGGILVTLDAEDHTTTDSRLAIVRKLRDEFPDVGTVLQAYLKRTEDDCRELSGPRSRIRLCKGAYDEPVSVAFQKPSEVSASYLRCLRVLMDGDGYPMVASHDPEMTYAANQLARTRGPDTYEYQMLFGIRDTEQQRLADDGDRVRVYVPYGDQWYGYFMRRLAERPANLVFFLRSLVPEKVSYFLRYNRSGRPTLP